MDSLIKRLQKAESGSQKLDAEICIALQFGGVNSLGAQNVRTDKDWEGDLLYEIGTEECCGQIPNLTTSIDAIVALIGEKLPGCEWEVGYDSVTQRYSAATNPIWWFDAPTPALALCIALLSATPLIGRGET